MLLHESVGKVRMCFESMFMLTAVFLLRPAAVQCGGSVSYSSTQVCGLKEASVVLSCSYHYSWIGHYMGGEWYDKKGGIVREVSSVHKYPDCSLKIDELTDQHSGVYCFRFYTFLHRSWITASKGVTLLVTDLRVKEESVGGDQNQTKVTCNTSCDLGSQYVWYKNGQQVQDKTTASILLDLTRAEEEGSYSCAVQGYKAPRSPAVCAPAKQCWHVTYSSNSLCVLKGSSVDISCTYKYPRDQTINTAFWFKNILVQPSNHLGDLSLDKGYQNHTECHRNKEKSCTLSLKDIKESHSGEYGFRCVTEQGESYTGLPGVNITVTGLQVLIPPEAVTEGESVNLTCDTNCSLSNHPTFIWYKNGQPLNYQPRTRHTLHLNPVSSEDAGSYSCAVRHEDLTSTDVFLNVTYKPKNVLVSISHDEEEGRSVTLTCSSDANPPVHNYTWYMKSGAESLVRGTGESISFNVTSDTSGLYYCEAQNELGSQNSTEVAILSQGFEAVAILSAIITIIIVLAILLMLGIMSLRKKNAKVTADRRPNDSKMQNDSCLMHNTVAARALTSDSTHRVEISCDQDSVQYARVQKKSCKRQEEPLYSTVEIPQTSAQYDNTVCTSSQLHRGSAATRPNSFLSCNRMSAC